MGSANKQLQSKLRIASNIYRCVKVLYLVGMSRPKNTVVLSHGASR